MVREIATVILLAVVLSGCVPPVLWYGQRIATDGKLVYDTGPRPEAGAAADGGNANAAICRVTRALLKYGTPADAPLALPAVVTVPAPGGADTSATGASVGFVPGSAPRTLMVANAFEFHADLNGIAGCDSHQERKYMSASTKTAAAAGVTGITVGSDGAGFSRLAPFVADTYDGDTQTGQRTLPSGEVIYEGTPAKIHWVDAVRMTGVPRNQTANRDVYIALALVRSIARDGNRVSGTQCLSGHATIIEYQADGTPAAMPAANARRYLDGLNRVKPGPNEPANIVAAREYIVSLLRSTPDQGGFQGTANPEFRDLGCYPL